MSQSIRIQLLGGFEFIIDGRVISNPLGKSRKSMALIEYLVMKRGEDISIPDLLREIWPDLNLAAPEKSLKTLISRLRVRLNKFFPGLCRCIVSRRGYYYWSTLNGMTVDVLELLDLFDKIQVERDEAALHDAYRRIVMLYRGNLYMAEDLEKSRGYARELHSQYLAAVHGWIDLLRKEIGRAHV